MKTYLNSLLIVLLIIMSFSDILAQTDRDGAKSVVRITTTFTTTENGKRVTKENNASGWCWKDSRHIITDLHVVAGVPNENIIIFTEKKANWCGAKVEKVLYEADLALLMLDKDLGLIPLEIQDADPNSKAEFNIWGFPHGIESMSGEDIRFSRSLTSVPTLNNIISGNELKFKLEKQGYPSPRANILRISSTIQPGHSGAPIMTNNGKVVAIADGGLREGIARLNWAMPATKYVPLLLTSSDVQPNTVSMQVELYSNTTIVEIGATEAEQNAEIIKQAEQNVIENGTMSVTKTWTATYDEITETMSEVDLEGITSLVATYNFDMSDTKYDVYEDFETGATITVPFGEDFSVEDGWFYTSNADSTIFYDAMPFDYETYELAKLAVMEVYNECFDEDDWENNAYFQDYSNVVDADETANYTFMRVAKNGNGQNLTYNAKIEGSNLLVTYVIYDSNLIGNDDYVKKFFQYALAIRLATFSAY
jgi:hypothetical protein